jgi:hypothetical protein
MNKVYDVVAAEAAEDETLAEAEKEGFKLIRSDASPWYNREAEYLHMAQVFQGYFRGWWYQKTAEKMRTASERYLSTN